MFLPSEIESCKKYQFQKCSHLIAYHGNANLVTQAVSFTRLGGEAVTDTVRFIRNLLSMSHWWAIDGTADDIFTG